ncbi:MAG TPA: YciI family protein [Erysipelotrichaceae bacterium]|nr:YciI family protein [Erysipelotrichaceae bacterium]
MKQYVYTLKLVPRLLDDANWTSLDKIAVDQHLSSLERLLEEGVLVLAGRTLDEDEKMFGIVIFETETDEQAEHIMLNDPAVKAGIMVAELHPYRVALIRK